MISSLINLLFPKVCNACYTHLTDNEKYVCTNCRHALPLTGFHKNNDDTLKKVLYGRAKIELATALLYFEKKGIVQHLIHQLKYKGYEEIGVFLGEWLGAELKLIPAYKSIDLVIPVPLHKKKKRRRGFNQVAQFGKKIAASLDINYVDNVLIKVTNTTSQVSKKRFARWHNDKDQFSINNMNRIANKHILLVDDLITTGATLEACIIQLNKADNVKISIATMAIA